MRNLLVLALITFSLSFVMAQKGDQCNCMITLDIHPVCGSNGFTYDNLSELECASKCEGGVRLQHNGACQPPHAQGRPKGYPYKKMPLNTDYN